MEIRLGQLVKDKVTGFEGIAISRCYSLFEASKIKVQPKGLDTAGKITQDEWLEEGRLEEVDPEAKPLAGFLSISGKR